MDNSVSEKSFEFAVRVVNLYKYLIKEHKEFVMARQILRCGTSIGANIAEAQKGQSKAGTPQYGQNRYKQKGLSYKCCSSFNAKGTGQKNF